MAPKSHQQYGQDFYAWAIHSAKLIHAGKFSKITIEHFAEEVESMGKRELMPLPNKNE